MAGLAFSDPSEVSPTGPSSRDSGPTDVPHQCLLVRGGAIVRAEAVEARAGQRLAMRLAGQFAASVPRQFHGPAARLEDASAGLLAVERAAQAAHQGWEPGRDDGALAEHRQQLTDGMLDAGRPRRTAPCRPSLSRTRRASSETWSRRSGTRSGWRSGPAHTMCRRWPRNTALAATLARRKDALLELAEGMARRVGVLTVAAQIDRDPKEDSIKPSTAHGRLRA